MVNINVAIPYGLISGDSDGDRLFWWCDHVWQLGRVGSAHDDLSSFGD